MGIAETAADAVELRFEHFGGRALNSSRQIASDVAPATMGPSGVSIQGETDAIAIFDLTRRLAEQAREGGAEAAVRIEAGVEDRVVDGRAIADAYEGLAQAARAAVGLKRHAVLAQEVAADTRGFEAHVA